MTKQIFLVDDDELFRESLGQNLEDAGYTVLEAGDGRAFLDLIEAGKTADLVLLDWKMPRMNGLEALKELRRRSIDLPVILLTVLGDQIYEEAALLGGAVDFVEKSRSFSILKKRIDLIISGDRGQAAPSDGKPVDDIALGDLQLRVSSGRAVWRGNEVDLTLTEFRIIQLLAERSGQDVPYRDIYDVVHGPGFLAGVDAEGYRVNVRTFIKRIRQKFRNIDHEFEQIENYPGFGYRWREERDRDA